MEARIRSLWSSAWDGVPRAGGATPRTDPPTPRHLQLPSMEASERPVGAPDLGQQCSPHVVRAACSAGRLLPQAAGLVFPIESSVALGLHKCSITDFSGPAVCECASWCFVVLFPSGSALSLQGLVGVTRSWVHSTLAVTLRGVHTQRHPLCFGFGAREDQPQRLPVSAEVPAAQQGSEAQGVDAGGGPPAHPARAGDARRQPHPLPEK